MDLKMKDEAGNWNSLKRMMLDSLHPVGSIYIDRGTGIHICPLQKTLGGTWVREAGGRVLVGYAGDQAEFNSIGKTGGAKTHTLTAAQMPTHEHRIRNHNPDGSPQDGHTYTISASSLVNDPKGFSHLKTTTSGSGQAHNNLQPYITVNIWRRTA